MKRVGVVCVLAVLASGCNRSALPNLESVFGPTVITEVPGTANELSDFRVGDFNNDGKLDVLALPCESDGLVMLLGAGDGSLSATKLPQAIAVEQMEVGDVSGDNHLDVVLLQPYIDRTMLLTVLRGNGDGTFRLGAHINLPGGDLVYRGFGLSDLNGDRHPDIALFESWFWFDGMNGGLRGSVSAYLNNGDGTFKQDAVVTEVKEPDTILDSVHVADFNGDAKLDLLYVAGFEREETINLMLGNGDGTFAVGNQKLSFKGHELRNLDFADYNADKRLDVLVIERTFASKDDTTVKVYHGDGNGGFDGGLQIAGSDFGDPSFSRPIHDDFNVDGRVDLLFLQSHWSSGSDMRWRYDLVLKQSQADGYSPDIHLNHESFTGLQGCTMSHPPFSPRRVMASGDFTSDGMPDIVMDHWDEPAKQVQIHVIINTSIP